MKILRNLSVFFAVYAFACAPGGAQTELPALHDGLVVVGGSYRHDGSLVVQGRLTLRNLTLELHGPIEVMSGARLELDRVALTVADPPGAANGISGLNCKGPAHIVVRNSTMRPIGTAHPMWGVRGQIEVENFKTLNSELHLDHAKARLDGLTIFELEISHDSQVKANGLDLVFLSTHSSENDSLQFAHIPVERPFSRTLMMGSGARAELQNARLQIFLLYLHGHARAELEDIDRAQLALTPDCQGTLRLPHGRMGTASKPFEFPAAGQSNCGFHLRLNNVNVDTWDVYAIGHAQLTFENSLIDELIVSNEASVTVRNSDLYADWLGVGDQAKLNVEDSTVGALRLAAERPDLATSQIHVSGRGVARFNRVRFDCGLVANGHAKVRVEASKVPLKFVRSSGDAQVLVDGRIAGR
ncbi:MAG: hypothetical protein KGN79_10035 [Acidobacteriota bacterium]|nr:hypothetical protein [Acidobacteriota bacterium]